MSSHHIVRDFQEPPLYIMSLSGGLPAIAGELLEWSPYTIVDGSLIETWLSMGNRCDAVLGKKPAHAGFEMEQISPSKDALEAIVAHLRAKTNIRELSIRVVGERTPEEAIGLMNDFSHEITYYSDRFMAFPLRGRFEKWMPEGRHVIVDGDDSTTITGNYISVNDEREINTTGGFVNVACEKGVWLEFY